MFVKPGISLEIYHILYLIAYTAGRKFETAFFAVKLSKAAHEPHPLPFR